MVEVEVLHPHLLVVAVVALLRHLMGMVVPALLGVAVLLQIGSTRSCSYRSTHTASSYTNMRLDRNMLRTE